MGKYVRVGMPQGDLVPVCSSAISNDCWKLCEERDGNNVIFFLNFISRFYSFYSFIFYINNNIMCLN